MAGVVLGPVDLGRFLVGEDGGRPLVVVHEREEIDVVPLAEELEQVKSANPIAATKGIAR